MGLSIWFPVKRWRMVHWKFMLSQQGHQTPRWKMKIWEAIWDTWQCAEGLAYLPHARGISPLILIVSATQPDDIAEKWQMHAFPRGGQIAFFPLSCRYCGKTGEGQSFKYARVLFNLHNLLTNMLRGSLKEIKSKKKFCLPTVNVNVSGKHFYMDWFTVFDLVWQRYMTGDREANTDQTIWRKISALSCYIWKIICIRFS